MALLTNPRHERFAQGLAKGKSADEAYAEAGYSPNDGNCIRLKGNERIALRVAELLERGALRAEVTIASICEELDEAHALARQIKQPATMVSASMGKAKVTGLLVERTEMTGKDGGPIQTEDVSAIDVISRRIASIAARTSENSSSSRTH